MSQVLVGLEERELIVAGLALFCFAWVWVYRASLASIAGFRILFWAFAIRVFGYQLTVIEVFVAPLWVQSFDLLEHFANFVQSALLLLWVASFWRRQAEI